MHDDFINAFYEIKAHLGIELGDEGPVVRSRKKTGSRFRVHRGVYRFVLKKVNSRTNPSTCSFYQ